MDEQTTATLEATSSEVDAAQAPQAPEPVMSLSEDGELDVSDGFWGDGAGASVEDEPAPEPVPEAPVVYTDDELRDTPWEQWDEARITGDVKRYIPFLRDQMERRARVAQMMGPQHRPMPQPPAAPQMGTKEIAAEAAKAAKAKLGLGEDDALDFYEPEHVAALSLAAQEIQASQREAVARAERTAQDVRAFEEFAAGLAARSDFAEFDRWVTGRLASAGMHPEQLREYAVRTGDVAGVHRTVAGWYQAWQEQKAKPKAAQKPPVVEGGTGGVPGKRGVDLRGFGDMDDDDQARALMDMGLV